MAVIQVTYTLEEVPGKGWIAHADELRASAQGDSADEALANLRALVDTYPEVLKPLLEASERRERARLELIPA